uniref:Uncharacterized protein n=1 Tax=Siphoviridae sp. ctMCY8 TaxID=2827854 RepID=A0A8S5TBF2_9CAUD|nr:MAG TPA: hypothetical protein [Siphoviridae sp. ctMCY8]
MPGGFLAGSIHFWMPPPLRMSPLLGMPCFKAPSQIPPDVATLHWLRFWVRGNAVQMRGKQAFRVWQYTFITRQRKSAGHVKILLCAVLCAV